MKRSIHKLAAIVLAISCGCPLDASASGYGEHAVTSVIPGVGATNQGKAEDAAAANADTLIPTGAVRQDSNDTAVTSANGDYTHLTANSMGNLKVQVEPSVKQSYIATSPSFTAVVTNGTDIVEFLGSGTKTVKIQKVFVSYYAATSATHQFFVLKRSTASTGGSSSALGIIPIDSNNNAATATGKHFTGNPTVGSLVGYIAMIAIGASATGAGNVQGWTCVFDEAVMGQPIVLRGTGQSMCVNGNSSTPGGTSASIAVTIVFTEE